MNTASENFVSTRNPCKACAPLGAALAFSGVKGATPLLHGSQGCATYIRRYLIGHFREPMDIASSNFHEQSAIFGGRDNLRKAIANVIRQYAPEVIGVATTCLAETIGDDVRMILDELRRESDGDLPHLISVSTPSYNGTHADGFHDTVRAIVERFAVKSAPTGRINLFPGIASPEDVRQLKRIFEDFGAQCTVLPDYSDTLDGPAWETYRSIPDGGTPVAAVKEMGGAAATIEFTATRSPSKTPGALLEEACGVQNHALPLPMSIRLADVFFGTLEEVTGNTTPECHCAERGRLMDAFVDGHKYVFGKRALVYGEADLVVGLTAFLTEIGMTPVLCATGGTCRNFESVVREWAPGLPDDTIVRANTDFKTMEAIAQDVEIDALIGNGNGYALARTLDVPLIRVGLPVHDRLGAARIRTLGYGGIQQLYDRIVNAFIERRQDASAVGYTHI